VIIGYTGIKVIKQAIDDSMDKNDEEMMEGMCDLLNEYRHDDWIDIYKLRMIKYGPKLFVDMHVIFPSDMSITHTYEEEKQIEEAIKNKFGMMVEVSVTPAPCSERFCRFCDRNCFNRTEVFEKNLKWTPDSLMTPNMHLPPSPIEIDGSINPKE